MNEVQEPLVTICCITYNHEKYIRDAIEGFLMQKTNFPFEIIIHDDASTDMTANIIREYENKYPELIKPIYQIENQHSKGIKTSTLIFKQAKGKYIAFCEGDDYWTNPDKLQIQVDYMEQNPNCTLCFHNALLANDTKGILKIAVIPQASENKIYFFDTDRKYTAGELILLGFIPLASFVFPKNVVNNLPIWFFEMPAGDYALKLLASSYGYAYYINNKMSVYRVNVKGSTLDRWKNEPTSKKVIRINRFLDCLNSFNSWTNYEFNNEVDTAKKNFEFRLDVARKSTNIFNDEKYNDYFRQMSLRRKIIFYVNLRFPILKYKLEQMLPFEIKYKLLK